MKCVTSAAALILCVASMTATAGPASAQARAQIQNPQIEIAYVRPRSPAMLATHETLRTAAVLEELKQFLAPLKLPKRLAIRTDECGAVARPYRPGGAVTICYELFEKIAAIAEKANPNVKNAVIYGAFAQATLHEVAHAVMDYLGVPVWGNVNDAADRLAALIMLQFGDEVARQTVIGTAVFFELSGRTWTGSEFADVNSPEPQRYFNYLCIAYGGSPKTFEFLVKAEEGKNPILPERRSKRCRGEYEQIRKAFNLRIMPHIDPDMLVRVKSQQWMKPR